MISPTTRPTSDEVRLSRLVLQQACHEPLRGRQPGVDLRARMGTDEWVAVDADVGEASFERLDELCRPRASAADLALLRGTVARLLDAVRSESQAGST